MAIARTLVSYLDERGIHYDLVEHKHTATALETASLKHFTSFLVLLFFN